jgi:hypothetical protein
MKRHNQQVTALTAIAAAASHTQSHTASLVKTSAKAQPHPAAGWDTKP